MTRKTSNITLFSGVPLDDTYKNVVDQFTSVEDWAATLIETYPHINMSGSSWSSLNKPVRWDSKDVTYNELINYNYMMIEDQDHKGHTRIYFAFTTNFEYLNDGTTLIFFSIDIWNTYRFRVDFNKAFIKRAFVKELNSAGTDWSNEFKKVMNLAEDIGGDGASKLIRSTQVNFWEKTNSSGQNQLSDGSVRFVLFTTQPKQTDSSGGSLIGAYSQYLYSFLAYNPGNGRCYDIYKGSEKLISLNGMSISEAYQKLAKDPLIVGTSSLVVDSEIYNYLGLPAHISASGESVVFDTPNVQFTKWYGSADSPLISVTKADKFDFKAQEGMSEKIEYNYNGNLLQQLTYIIRKEYGQHAPLKLLFNPYSKLYLTNGRGGELTIDLANFSSLNKTGVGIRRFGGISENGKEVYTVLNYNRETTQDYNHLVTYENAQIVDNAPRDTPIVVDSYTEFINANRNQLRNTRANAKMNEQLAKQGNALNLSQSNRARDVAYANQAYSQGRNLEATKIKGTYDTAIGALGGAVAGGATGGIAGALLGGVTGGLKTGVNSMMNYGMQQFNNQTAMNVSNSQRANEAQNAAENFAFQNKVATNNYEQTIRSQNAMLADTKNHNDQVAHEGSNFLFDFQNDNSTLHLQLFTSQPAVMENIALYFTLFGYTVAQYAPIADYTDRKTVFDYVQTENAQTKGRVNVAVVEFFNKMFNNGVTIWHDFHSFQTRTISDNEFK